MAVFCVMTPCNLLDVYQRFAVTCCLVSSFKWGAKIFTLLRFCAVWKGSVVPTFRSVYQYTLVGRIFKSKASWRWNDRLFRNVGIKLPLYVHKITEEFISQPATSSLESILLPSEKKSDSKYTLLIRNLFVIYHKRKYHKKSQGQT